MFIYSLNLYATFPLVCSSYPAKSKQSSCNRIQLSLALIFIVITCKTYSGRDWIPPDYCNSSRALNPPEYCNLWSSLIMMFSSVYIKASNEVNFQSMKTYMKKKLSIKVGCHMSWKIKFSGIVFKYWQV